MLPYLELCERILLEGKWVVNKRTNTRCLTVINVDLTYDVSAGKLPLVTTRKAPFKLAVAELLGYLRGYTNAQDFAELGAPTWFANANDNKVWLENPNRKGTDDIGLIYGAVARNWPNNSNHAQPIDTIRKVVNDLMNHEDDRGEIITFWNPGMFEQGCLRPCLYSHHFSVLDDTLYLNSTQRSSDVPLGLVANMVQCSVLLALMAQITGLKPGKAYHKIVNAHIYEDQVELMKEQIKRVPYESPYLRINPEIKSLADIETWVSTADFQVDNYIHHEPIKYPFTV